MFSYSCLNVVTGSRLLAEKSDEAERSKLKTDIMFGEAKRARLETDLKAAQEELAAARGELAKKEPDRR